MVVFVLFNLGLPLIIIGQPGLTVLGGYGLGVMASVGALLQLIAGIILLIEVRGYFKENQ